MSNSQAVHPAALLRRLLRAQLRLKVMAGVVVVTLLALVAFDVGAVATMRRYLLTQTDSSLQGALTLTLPRLAAALAFTSQATRVSNYAVPGQVVRPAHVKTLSLPGAFDMTFLPFHGQQVTLQVAANSPAGGSILRDADWNRREAGHAPAQLPYPVRSSWRPPDRRNA